MDDKDYTFDELRQMKKDNTELWQMGGKQLVRQLLVTELMKGSVDVEYAYKIQKEFELDFERWEYFAYGDS